VSETDPDEPTGLPIDSDVYDHLRAVDADVPAGVYRVVGVAPESVTLVRVGDSDGRRVHTGEVVTVDVPLAGFERADDPDRNRPVGAVIRSALSGLYWSVRAFGSSLLAHPLASALALTLLVAGSVVERALPDPAPIVLVVAGTLALAYVGGGHL